MIPERRDRGQLVLLAAALAALALVPLVVAYLQLGVHPDVAARTDPGHETDRIVRSLDRATANASRFVSAEYRWANRSDALAVFDRTLTPDVRRIEQSRLVESVAINVTRNATVAQRWADSSCPGGQNRQFGDCVVENGIVLQERAGETYVLAVGLDVVVSGPRGTTEVVIVAESVT